MERESKRFFYLYNSSAVAYDIYAYNLPDARKRLRKYLEVKRLPRGTQVWKA